MNRLAKGFFAAALAAAVCLGGLWAAPQASAEGLSPPRPKFTDLPSMPWYYDFLIQSVDLGFFSGTSSTTFSPDRPLTRAQAVVVLSKVHKELTGETISASQPADYADVPSDSYYSKAVAWATENKIVSGRGKHSFAPNQPVTHAELAVMFHQYLELVGRADLYQPVEGAYLDEAGLPGWVKPHVRALSGYQLFNLQFPHLDLAFEPQAVTLRSEAAALFVRLYEKALYPRTDQETPRWACRYSLPGSAPDPFHPLGEEGERILTSYEEYTQLMAVLQGAAEYAEEAQPAALTVTEETFQENALLAVEIREEWAPIFLCDFGGIHIEEGVAKAAFLKSELEGSSVGGRGYVFLLPVPKDTTRAEVTRLSWTERENVWPN